MSCAAHALLQPPAVRDIHLVACSLCSPRSRVDGSRVRVQGRQMLMGDEPFLIRGMCYSPVPINESVYFAPYGDYFTPDYSFIWLRDLPLIKSMGVNVVRTYGWQPANDHTAFLDAATNNDLYVMATFYMGDVTESPVSTAADRSKLVKTFTKEVAKYAEHPSLLFWSFGNELNGVWNKYLQELSKSEWNGVCIVEAQPNTTAVRGFADARARIACVLGRRSTATGMSGMTT